MTDAAAEATVWLMLLSCSVHEGPFRTRAAKPCQKTNPTSSAMIDMLKDQPIFRPA